MPKVKLLEWADLNHVSMVMDDGSIHVVEFASSKVTSSWNQRNTIGKTCNLQVCLSEFMQIRFRLVQCDCYYLYCRNQKTYHHWTSENNIWFKLVKYFGYEYSCYKNSCIIIKYLVFWLFLHVDTVFCPHTLPVQGSLILKHLLQNATRSSMEYRLTADKAYLKRYIDTQLELINRYELDFLIDIFCWSIYCMKLFMQLMAIMIIVCSALD